MNTIIGQPTASSQYFQLPAQAKNTGPTALIPAAGTTAAETQSATPSYADIVDLSPQAKQLLGLSENKALSGARFTLNHLQQEKISRILAEYAEEPLTQETYESIQDDLKSAGLAPDQLALQESAASISVVQMFFNALLGKSTTISIPQDATMQARQANYMHDIYLQWRNMAGRDATSSPTDVSPVPAS